MLTRCKGGHHLQGLVSFHATEWPPAIGFRLGAGTAYYTGKPGAFAIKYNNKLKHRLPPYEARYRVLAGILRSFDN